MTKEELKNEDIRKLLDHYKLEYKDGAGEIRMKCPIHGGDNPTAFVIKKDTNHWFCNSGECGEGDVIDFIKKFEGVSYLSALDILKNIYGVEELTEEDKIKLEANKFVSKFKSSLIKEIKINMTYIEDKTIPFDRFEDEVLDYYHAKKCSVVNINGREYRNKLLIPITENLFELRTLTNEIPKCWYPPSSNIKDVLYNLNNCKGSDEIVVVEGIMDVWAYHCCGIDNCICLFGSAISSEQFKLLAKENKKLILSFDNDEAGRKATRNVAKAFTGILDIEYINLPENKDPYDCIKELKELYGNRSKEHRTDI